MPDDITLARMAALRHERPLVVPLAEDGCEECSDPAPAVGDCAVCGKVFETPTGYCVVPGPHGIAVFGTCSLVHLHGLTRIAKEEGYTETSPEIATALAATTVFVSPASRKTWEAELERRGDLIRAGSKP